MEQPCLLTFISLAKNAASYKQKGWPFIITVSSLSLSFYSSQSEKKISDQPCLKRTPKVETFPRQTEQEGGPAVLRATAPSMHEITI